MMFDMLRHDLLDSQLQPVRETKVSTFFFCIYDRHRWEILFNGGFEFGLDALEDEIFRSFEQRVFGTRQEGGQIVENCLTLAARQLSRK